MSLFAKKRIPVPKYFASHFIIKLTTEIFKIYCSPIEPTHCCTATDTGTHCRSSWHANVVETHKHTHTHHFALSGGGCAVFQDGWDGDPEPYPTRPRGCWSKTGASDYCYYFSDYCRRINSLSFIYIVFHLAALPLPLVSSLSNENCDQLTNTNYWYFLDKFYNKIIMQFENVTLACKQK